MASTAKVSNSLAASLCVTVARDRQMTKFPLGIGSFLAMFGNADFSTALARARLRAGERLAWRFGSGTRTPMDALYDIDLTAIDGRRQKLAAYAGKSLLVVNVASRCGFTPQYEGLEALWRRYRERGLVVLGFPCDQFGHQEPGDAAEIANFCTEQYHVTFPLFAKTEVNGERAHPLYRALKAAAPGLLRTQAIKWNFTKFLVDRRGEAVRRYAPTCNPEKLADAIEALLG